MPAAAQAAQTATIQAGFAPKRLGAHAALAIGFAIRADGGGLPSALTAVEFHYPRQLSFAASELGLATCNPGALQARGPKACPPNSIMGTGSALAKFQVSPIVSEETASLALAAGPSPDGYVHMLIAATGTFPVAARIVMPTVLSAGSLNISVPLVPGVPEGPAVAVVAVKATIGGKLTYYRHVHGRKVAYHPAGISLPRHCPPGGLRFSATFSFLDGTQAQAQTRVDCAGWHG